jgi:hypothetical protein
VDARSLLRRRVSKMAESKAEWSSVAISLVSMVVLLALAYGKYTSDRATMTVQLANIEKVQRVSTSKSDLMEDELDVLWIDTQKNKDSIGAQSKELARFDVAFSRFADAVDRLSIAVAKLEERIKYSDINGTDTTGRQNE